MKSEGGRRLLIEKMTVGVDSDRSGVMSMVVMGLPVERAKRSFSKIKVLVTFGRKLIIPPLLGAYVTST